MIGFKPVPYRNNGTGSVSSVIHVTNENMTDCMEWAEINHCDVVGHPSTNFILYATDSTGRNYSINVVPNGMYLALNENGSFVGLPAGTEIDVDWAPLD